MATIAPARTYAPAAEQVEALCALAEAQRLMPEPLLALIARCSSLHRETLRSALETLVDDGLVARRCCGWRLSAAGERYVRTTL